MLNWNSFRLQVMLEEGEGASKQQIPLVVEGLTPHGFLRAVDSTGQTFELHPDGNSFDFFKGLIRKKLPAVT